MSRASDPTPRPAMRPLATLDPAALRGVRGVLTDVDDTLTRDGAIEPAALGALAALHEAGLPVIAIVAENGGVMLRRQTDGTLRRDFTTDEPTRERHAQRLAACAAAVLTELPGTTLAQDSPGRLTDIAIDHSEFTTLEEATIARVVDVMRRHGLTATVSSIHVNGWIGDHSKWTAARWAVETALGRPFDPAEWLFVGDSTNDQLMFERLPLTVGVANIARFLPQLAVRPAYVTQAERGEGFAEVAAKLLAARGR